MRGRRDHQLLVVFRAAVLDTWFFTLRLRLGDPVALLPLLHFILLKFSRHVAQCIHKAGYEVG